MAELSAAQVANPFDCPACGELAARDLGRVYRRNRAGARQEWECDNCGTELVRDASGNARGVARAWKLRNA